MKKYSLNEFLDIKISYGASFNEDETQIAFQDNSTGTMQLYLANIDGSDTRRLTDYTDRLMFAGFRPHHN
ncbi:MAG: TolB family protein, partial [Methyloligellaceae bacterium]